MHPTDCPCVFCNPLACPACGCASPRGTHLASDGRCSHRRACEGRQLLNAGAGVEEAAAHAQRLSTQPRTKEKR